MSAIHFGLGLSYGKQSASSEKKKFLSKLMSLKEHANALMLQHVKLCTQPKHHFRFQQRKKQWATKNTPDISQSIQQGQQSIFSQQIAFKRIS